MLSVALTSKVPTTFAIPIYDQTTTYQSCWREKTKKDVLRKNCGSLLMSNSHFVKPLCHIQYGATRSVLAFALQLRKKHGKTCQSSRRMPFGKNIALLFP